MGAHAIFYDHSAQRIGERESVKDYAKNLERWADAIIARVFDHRVLERFADHASIPVINALCDIEHPCQALADMLTLEESLGSLQGRKLAFVGDGNNVCHSLMLLGAMLGVSVTAVTPKGFEPQFEIARAAAKLAEKTGAVITLSHDLKAVQGHDAVYTDCWVSMGQGAQSEFRRERFGAFQVDPEVMSLASKGLDHPSIFMHCLPAHRGEEVTDEVIDSDRSVVYDQAENRMHAQNALLLALLANA
jgi:ornithine carbamoyltransferase